MPVTSLSTDLYQLTMLAGYVHAGRHETPATFEMFVRRLPRHRACLVTAGVEHALEYIEQLRFTSDEIAWIRELPPFAGIGPAFFDYLRSFRFSGDVWAMREGTPFFPHEPILRVTAPLAEAQLLETALLAILNFETTIASKAYRIVQAAAGHPVMEFGARRAHGVDAALYAARAAYIAGCTGTSFVEAGRRFGIPVSGTMAHSWVLAAASEREAFATYAELFKHHTVLLLDTYDVPAAAALVVESGLRPSAIRIDSGDLLASSRHVRDVFDRGGLRETQILVSGDLDEWKIRALVDADAPIDGFAVGTALTTSDDAPALGGVYKLVEIQERGHWRGVMKRSEGKATWPGRKQVWRIVENGTAVRDVISVDDEQAPSAGIPLLECVMRGGRMVPSLPLAAVRDHCARMVRMLPDPFRGVSTDPIAFPVQRSEGLQRLQDR